MQPRNKEPPMHDRAPRAAMLIIGDEILSGRTRDSNMHHLARVLTDHGVPLAEARVIGDDHDKIVAAVRDLAGRHDHLFTSGGIGPTHDDITAEAVAAAFDTPISVRDDAREILAAHYAARDTDLNAARLRMARIPDGATLIENPISAAPGFSLRNVHVMAGVPAIFEAMVASVLPGITGGAPLLSRSITLTQGEGDIAEELGALAHEMPDISFGSYPYLRDGRHGVTVVARSHDPARLDTAMDRLAALFDTP
jgi:molybdenum cofactor synthesis domain-containing protein